MEAMEISRSGLDVEWQRLQVIAENIANMGTTRTANGGTYLARRLVSGPVEGFASVLAGRTERSGSSQRGVTIYDVAAVNGATGSISSPPIRMPTRTGSSRSGDEPGGRDDTDDQDHAFLRGEPRRVGRRAADVFQRAPGRAPVVTGIEAIGALGSSGGTAPATSGPERANALPDRLGGADFGSLLMNGIGAADAKVAHADAMVAQFALDDSVPVHQVTIALEEARLSVEFAMQVRARLLEGYKELMNMQL